MFENTEIEREIEGCSQGMMLLMALAGFVLVLAMVGYFRAQSRRERAISDPVGAQADRLQRLYSAGQRGSAES